MSDPGSVMVELVATAETGDRGEIGPKTLGSVMFRPASRSADRNASFWIPRRWILYIPAGYSVGYGEILEVLLPTWKAREAKLVP